MCSLCFIIFYPELEDVGKEEIMFTLEPASEQIFLLFSEYLGTYFIVFLPRHWVGFPAGSENFILDWVRPLSVLSCVFSGGGPAFC